MRLIDADALIKAIQQHMVKINSLFEEEKTVVEIIDAQPTAYDVEKVVAEVEEAKGEISLYGDDLDIYCNGLDTAIDIVKRGGVE